MILQTTVKAEIFVEDLISFILWKEYINGIKTLTKFSFHIISPPIDGNLKIKSP